MMERANRAAPWKGQWRNRKPLEGYDESCIVPLVQEGFDLFLQLLIIYDDEATRDVILQVRFGLAGHRMNLQEVCNRRSVLVCVVMLSGLGPLVLGVVLLHNDLRVEANERVDH